MSVTDEKEAKKASMKDIIELLKENKYSVCTTMTKFVPKQYLDNEEFFEKAIPTRITYSPESVISYGTYRIKANKKLAKLSILTNGNIEGLYQKYKLPLSKEVEEEIRANKKYLITETSEDGKWLIAKSIVLENKAFILDLLEDLKNTTEFRNILFYHITKLSKVFAGNTECMQTAVKIDPPLYQYYTGDEPDKVVGQAILTMLKTDHFEKNVNEEFLKKQTKTVQKALLTTKKLAHLPEEAFTRRIFYKELCSHYLHKLKKEIETRVNNSNNKTV